jgi:hypothetical protein
MFCYGYTCVVPTYIALMVVPPTYTADIDDAPILAAILIIYCSLYNQSYRKDQSY